MRALLIVASLFGLAGCATLSEPSPATPPVVGLDAARFYVGTWYEIGRRPMSLTDGCVAGGTTYTPEGDGRVRVLDFCHAGGPTGPIKTIGGPAHIVDPGTNAKLHVSYRIFGIVPIPREYWVLEHAEDYSWFISTDPRFHDLWIYTRSPRPTPSEVERLTVKARALGYDTRLLEFPQTAPQP